MTGTKAPFVPTLTRVSYSVAEFADVCGMSEQVIRDHIAAGNLVPTYTAPAENRVRRKTYITLEEGLRWLRELPNE